MSTLLLLFLFFFPSIYLSLSASLSSPSASLFLSLKFYNNIIIFIKLDVFFDLSLHIFRPIKLVVAKCWDPNPKGYFTIPRTEPVRPIDPGAWVAHTAAIRGEGFPPRPPSATTLTSTSSSLASTLPDTERELY